MKKISIIIPTYNSSLTLRKTLKSIFSQTYQNFEIIIIDAYSKDGTLNIIRDFNSDKIRLFNVSKNKLLSYARYVGIKHATGSLIAFMDSDDYWNRNKLYLQILLIKNYKFCSTGFSLVKNNKQMTIINFPKYLNMNTVIFSRPIANSSVLVDKKLIYKISHKFQKVSFAEDYLWWLMSMKLLKKTLFIQKNLTYIKVVNQSRTSKNFFKNLSSLHFIYKNILGFNLPHILLIYIAIFYNNFKKKYFYYF